MFDAADLIHQALVPFLVTGGAVLGALFAYLFIQRALREQAWQRRQRLIASYRPLVDAIIESGLTPPALNRVRGTPVSHRQILVDLLLAPLHQARGEVVSHVRDAVEVMGFVERWRADLRHRHWWVRAQSARALGFIELSSALPAIMYALRDEHGEVRAAAVDACGRIGDARAIPALVAHLADSAHFQRARVVEALRCLGPTVTPALVEFARTRRDILPRFADVLGLIGTAAAIEPLLEWCGDSRGDVRAAALHALGSIGLDDRSYYFAVRGLGDADPHARAMAARALGRGRRADAVRYLAERLDDEWLPAAQAAEALRQLGLEGRAALDVRARDEGQAGDLARQMLWPGPSGAVEA
jgi:HEAT repeat protein